MRQQIFSGSINQATQQVLQIPLRNVGLVKKLIVKISATINNAATNAITPSDFGLANLLQNVVLTDLNNNVRVNTSGIHLQLLALLKKKGDSGSALLASAFNQAMNVGNNFGVTLQPASIAASGNGNLQAYFEVPLSYSDDDLRGALYANVVNAVSYLQLTIPTAAQTATPIGTDSTFAVYQGNTATLSNINITVYQEYLDQLPRSPSGIILPMLDLQTIYELKQSSFAALTVNQNFPVPFANFRNFLSTFLIYNHDGSGNVGRQGGNDINYLALQSANFTSIFQDDPFTNTFKTREILGADLPPGTYYESFRKKPLSTTNYGNMQLIVNPSTAAAQAYLIALWEDFAPVNILQTAGSLAG